MTNAQKNAAFLAAIDADTRNLIISNIAGHYGITPNEIHNEITGDGAEHLLDYVTGPERAATSVLMQRHGMAS